VINFSLIVKKFTIFPNLGKSPKQKISLQEKHCLLFAVFGLWLQADMGFA